ncbi:CAP domain-containing protein [Nocardioides zeae]
MRKLLSGLVLSLALVTGVLLVAPPPATAAATTTLTLSPTSVVAGGTTAVAVRSSFTPLAGDFRLQELRAGRWVSARELPSYRNYGFELAAGSTPGTRTFRVAAKADSRTWVHSRAVTLTVRSATSTALTTTTPQVARGGTVQLAARSTFLPDAGSFKLQEKRGSTWATVASLPSYKNYGFTHPAGDTDGVRTFRTVATAGGTWVGSSWVSVTVGTPATPPSDEIAAARDRIVADTNAARARQGLPALAQLSGITTVAQGWAETMAANRRMEHNPSYASQMPRGWTRAAENVAYGYGVSAVVAAWMDSPGHRANILGDFTHIGVGVARGSDGRLYYVQNFGRY